MKNIINEYGKTIVYFLIAFSFIGYITMALQRNKEVIKEEPIHTAGNNTVLKQTEKPTIVCKISRIKKGEVFKPLSYVTAKDANGKDLTSTIEVFGNIDTTKKGSYDLRYTVRDQYGIFNAKTFTFIVD